MSRPPNFGTSQWHKTLERPSEHPAECAKRPDLPWTDDKTPDLPTYIEMREVCADCKRIFRCAEEGLATVKTDGAAGGMYAGIWLPWVNRHDKPIARHRHNRALLALRRIANKG